MKHAACLKTPLPEMLWNQTRNLFSTVLQFGTRVEARDSTMHWTALDHAAHDGILPMVCLLLTYGADPHHLDDGGYSPLYRAIFSGHETCALVMLGWTPIPVELSGTPSDARSLLEVAASNNLPRVLDKILATHQVSYSDALVKAASEGHARCVARLLTSGHPASFALDAALYGGHAESARLLLAAGAVPNQLAVEHVQREETHLRELLREFHPDAVRHAQTRLACKHKGSTLDGDQWSCDRCGAVQHL